MRLLAAASEPAPRSGILSSGLFQLKTSSHHIRGITVSASRSSSRAVSGLAPKVSNSLPPDLARPISKRPSLKISSTAARSATRHGPLIRNGASTPACPIRRRWVFIAIAVSKSSGAELWLNSGVPGDAQPATRSRIPRAQPHAPHRSCRESGCVHDPCPMASPFGLHKKCQTARITPRESLAACSYTSAVPIKRWHSGI